MSAAMRDADMVTPYWAMAMQTLEQRGDQLTSSRLGEAEQTFMTPLGLEDILALIVAVDGVLDFIEDFTVKLADYAVTPLRHSQRFAAMAPPQTGRAPFMVTFILI